MTENIDLPQAINSAGVPATFANVRYGNHERNTFDIWLADSNGPTPLAIYIHGGGLRQEAKKNSSPMIYRIC